MGRGLPTCVLAMVVTATLHSQQPNVPPGQPMTFDTASVKRNTSGDSRTSAGATPGGYSATNVPLRFLLMSAFRVRRDQITGGPDWLDRERFDIVARAPEGAAPASMSSRLQALLRERFKLVARVESRDHPIYALVRTRPNGPVSANLKPSALACAPPGTAGNPCGLSGTIGAVAGSVKATGQTMSEFAAYLGFNVDRMVVDRTGLSGRFDFDLAWTADDVRGLAIDAPSTPPGNDRGALFTVLGEQLALKLEPARGLVDLLVIDNVERPTDD
jgi:uncharacterized protein (TIGR03435 family)